MRATGNTSVVSLAAALDGAKGGAASDREVWALSSGEGKQPPARYCFVALLPSPEALVCSSAWDTWLFSADSGFGRLVRSKRLCVVNAVGTGGVPPPTPPTGQTFLFGTQSLVRDVVRAS